MNIHETAARLHSEADRGHWNQRALAENIAFFKKRMGRVPKSKQELRDYLNGLKTKREETS